MPDCFATSLDYAMDIGYVPVITVTLFATLVIAPVLAHMLHQLHDPYCVRLVLYLIFVLVLCTISIHFAVLFNFYLYDKGATFFLPTIILVLGYIFFHSLFVLWPAVAVMLNRPKSKQHDLSLSSFQCMMNNPRGFVAFKSFAANEYSIDDVLFYKLAQTLPMQNKTKHEIQPFSATDNITLIVKYDFY
jgi:hypothetical protein